MKSYGWAVPVIMLLAAIGLFAYATSLLIRHGPPALAAGNFAVGALSCLLSLRSFKRWRGYKEKDATTKISNVKAGKRVWQVVAGLGAVWGLLTLAAGVVSGRTNVAFLGGGLLAFSFFSLWFSARIS
jgi:hypothetical protein